MKLGVIVPQGWTGEYDGWETERAWDRTVAVAQQADRLGFESIWLFDHLHTVPRPTDEITFESFTSLSALAALTDRVRLGHIVICNGFRNPALTAKMASTMDAISGGRMELGIGAGWKRDEWNAYGYGFPETPVRLAMLHDALEVISRMLEPGKATHATHEGTPSPGGRRAQRPEADPGERDADHGRRQRPERDLAPRRALRGRAERRRPLPRRGARGASDDPRALRGDRPRPRLARRQRPRLVGDRGVARRRGGRDASCCARTPTSG